MNESSLIELLQTMNPDVLGATLVVGTIFFFMSLIVSVVTVCNTLTHIVALRSNKSLVQDLLSKGYSVDDVERLVYGPSGWKKLTLSLIHI